jgi:hypothetical protein
MPPFLVAGVRIVFLGALLVGTLVGYGGAALGLLLGLTVWDAAAILLFLGQGSTLSLFAALGFYPYGTDTKTMTSPGAPRSRTYGS